ncbi:EAL domain-containing protein [Butyrivibrio sp. AE2032]|uniref:EAL domain-containing protein n=1 Tax=Butyrivibrio sp. AE2032 TaxID=1458463 RepID=UPI000552B08C|nr:EAL domain-containing protein [Butyrivibrio sp. AE2032]
MGLITSPQSYNIAFSIASLLLVIIVLVIDVSEEAHNNRQKQIFGMIIFDALILNVAGLLHNAWLYNETFNNLITADMNVVFVLTEKICSYLMAYFSTLYVLSIFRIYPDNFIKKVVLLLPELYCIVFFASGLFTDYYFTFSEAGELEYNYLQGASVNLCLFIYFPFVGYLFVKYIRTLSSEKEVALIMYYLMMLAGIPIRILTKSSSVFEFSVSLALLMCVYTFQNPSEFADRISGAGTKNALNFTVSTNLLQKKVFTVFGIAIERIDVITGGEPLEAVSELLNQITAYLKQLCPEGNTFYTDDGHYIMIFPEAEPDDPVIEKTAEIIQKRFKEPWRMSGQEIRLFQSPYAIGFPDEVDTLEKFNEVRDVIKKALLRHNKEVLRFRDLNLKHVEHDKKIDNIVRHALDDELLEVYYQPIYNPKEKKFTSCEALLRLRDPQLGFISPAIFMPVAERNGTVIAIDNFVLKSVCELISSTDMASLGLDYVEVNLSVVDCIQTNLADNVKKTLNKYNVRPDQINLEITETFEEGITSAMDENIRSLKEFGMSFSMDDFGTGYSNLARISSLPVDIFKLDKSIIQSAFESETSYMVMINLVKIIKAMDKLIVAEGVETEEQAKQIIRVGCDHIQGFFYARPMPKDRFIEFLRKNNQ